MLDSQLGILQIFNKVIMVASILPQQREFFN